MGVGALAKVGLGGVGLGRAKWEDLGIGVWGARAPASCNLRAPPPTTRRHGAFMATPGLLLLGLKFNRESGTRRLMRPICPLPLLQAEWFLFLQNTLRGTCSPAP